VARLVGANGEEVGIAAPIAGLIRGLTRDGVPVEQGTKVLEIDPRGLGGQWRGIGERPRRIAEGVVEAVQLAETALRSG
jgi:xanthine dehydrogenase accessory factor